MTLNVAGTNAPRRDLAAKLTGEARYTADLKLPGMLHAAILRSPHPHANVIAVDTAAAQQLPGVRAIITPFTPHSSVRPNPNTPSLSNSGGGPNPNTPSLSSSGGGPNPNTPSLSSPGGGPNPTIPSPSGGGLGWGKLAPDLPILDTRVRFVGDEVAAIAADDPDTARQAIQLLRVQYAPLPHALTPEAALAPGAAPIHPGGNLAMGEPLELERGSVADGFAAADVILQDEFEIPTHSAAPLEPRAALASWNEDNAVAALTVWKTTRGVHADRDALAAALRIPAHRIRVIGPFLGGGYGNKDETRLAAIAAALSQIAGRPVRAEYSREDEFIAGRVRHAAKISIRAGFRADATITAIEADALLDTGAYLASGPGVARRAGQAILYLYHCANVKYRARLAYTNRPTAGSYRALGAPQGHFALESLMDRAAQHFGMDPLDFRLMNHVRPEGQPGQRATPRRQIIDSQPVEGGIPFSSNHLRQCLEQGAAAFGWRTYPNTNTPSAPESLNIPNPSAPESLNIPNPSAPESLTPPNPSAPESPNIPNPSHPESLNTPTPPNTKIPSPSGGGLGWGRTPESPNPTIRRGRGMSIMLYRGGPGAPSAAEVRVEKSGAVKLITGLMDVGEGATTVLPQIAAEILGAEYAQVAAEFADTRGTPDAPITAGSTATFSTGAAVVQAATQVRQSLLEIASSVLEAPAQDLDAAQGWIFVKSDPARRMPLTEVAARMDGEALSVTATITPGSPDYIVNSFGAHFAEVEVDTATGRVRVLRYTAAHDSGRIINPRAALNQAEGAISQMLGFALSEELITDPITGLTLNPGYLEHKSPTIQDYPEIQILFTDTPDPIGPLGAKALGEVPTPGVAPAIANAIHHATGLRPRRPPFTPDRVLTGLLESDNITPIQ